MSYQKSLISVEFPSTIPQKTIWELEDNLQKLEGLSTDLQEPKDIANTVVTVLNIALPTMGAINTVVDGTKSIYEVARLLFKFVHHSSSQEKVISEANRKVVVKVKNKKYTIYGLSVEEIKELLQGE